MGKVLMNASKQRFLHKFIKIGVLAVCVLTISLLSQAALAGYQAPPDQKPPSGHTDSSGVR